MDNILLSPPVAFLILLATIGFLNYLFSRCAFRKGSDLSKEAKKAYSCGEEFSGHMIQPDYSQFFPFAFFFTVLHVVAMVIATTPAETTETFAVALVYIIGAVIGLLILLRK
jgi:NADH:ubiquinone oxidoreductase subunit 3 (subunit A)